MQHIYEQLALIIRNFEQPFELDHLARSNNEKPNLHLPYLVNLLSNCQATIDPEILKIKSTLKAKALS